jgi:hypothetical protein
MEASVEFVLPLLSEVAGTDDEAAFEIASRNQFLDEETCHDGLTRAWVVGKKEAQRLPRQHGLVHGSDLVREWIEERGVDGKYRIEEVREADAVCLRDKPK